MPGMRWRSLAVAGALSPAMAGCGIAHNAARNIVNEPHVVWTQHVITHDLRKTAQTTWEEIKGQCAEHADSQEFHEGFVDGYVDYLDRGGNGSLIAVPPAKYTRHPKYFTENGQCLVKEYLLGFKYGQEVAIATGRRQYLTVPVLLPQPLPEPPHFDVQPSAAPPMMPQPTPPPNGAQSLAGFTKESSVVVVPPAPVPPPPLPPLPVPRPAPKLPPSPDFDPTPKPVPPSASKGPPPAGFGPAPLSEPLPEPDRPAPALPLPPSVSSSSSGPSAWGGLPEIPPMPTPEQPPTPVPTPVPTPTLPVSPATPSMRIGPILPPNHTLPPPLPPNHPIPRN